MKYRVLGNLYSISKGDFIAYVENGQIELPEEIAENIINSGVIAPLDTEVEFRLNIVTIVPVEIAKYE